MTATIKRVRKVKRASKCMLCDATTGLHRHHVKPRSLGGTDDPDNLITLCERHHDVAHSLDDEFSRSNLTKIGLEKAKERGVVIGNRVNLKEAGIKGGETTKAKSDAFAQRFRPIIVRLQQTGMTQQEIADQFNVMGVPTLLNGLWRQTTVSGVLNRPTYH
ncbi:HNH endonuclease [Rugamonas aquatica]|uniref:HNH nuclease domain-containing protein n=1 Tax=Rugamonas aquatica TaxID=2743357 RepID=A0A6A7MYJ3_9BURK|nr:HNH endonuclease [Rugamonas aquatica]MQA37844.1 hypothetical protein [Rugamonas aquatica]